MHKIAIVVQGPIHTDIEGFATVDIYKSLQVSPLRPNLYVIASVWEDEPPELVQELAWYADQVVLCRKPALAGPSHRNYQREGVSCALAAIEHQGFKYVLKTRSDIVLSEKFLHSIAQLANSGFRQVLVTDIVTRYESFHISDMVLFSTFPNIKAWFDPREVYYQDAYSPEVQFARVFIRNKGLNYSMRFEDYLAFLRDWVELRNFHEEGLIWHRHMKVDKQVHRRINPHLKGRDQVFWVDPVDVTSDKPNANPNRLLPVSGIYEAAKRMPPHTLRVFLFYLLKSKTVFLLLYDRDCGPIMTRTMTVGFHRFLKETKIPLSYIATFLVLGDAAMSLLARKLPRWRHNYVYYTVDYKTTEHARPVG